MPVVPRDEGLRFFFHSNEGDPREPPHIHVRRGNDEAKFRRTPDVSLAYDEGLGTRTLNRVQKLVELHRNEFERSE